jgi:hypothetical protein
MIESRPIINYSNKISLFFDSDSLFSEIQTGNNNIGNLIKYHSVEGIISLKTDCETNHPIFSKIDHVSIFKEEEGDRLFYVLNSNPKKGDQTIVVEREKLLEISQKFFKSYEISPEIVRQVGPFFYFLYLSREKNIPILITSNQKILKMRKKRRVKDPDYLLTIFDSNEGSIFLSLFFKNQNKFYIAPNFTTSQNYWYDLFTCSKIPHLHFGGNGEILIALYKKCKYALMAVDKIGYQNYELGNLIGQDETLYHIYNLLTLLAGIFDNIGLVLASILNITNIPLEQISLRNSSKLVNLLKNNQNGSYLEYSRLLEIHGLFIGMIYSIRDIIVHRAGLDMITYSEEDIAKIVWKNLIKIDQSLPDLKSQILNYTKNQSTSKESKLSEWGVFIPPSKSGEYLHPFTFAVKIMNETANICDKFLEQMHQLYPDVPYYSAHLKEYDTFNTNYIGY